jgi:hypothetical protein
MENILVQFFSAVLPTATLVVIALLGLLLVQIKAKIKQEQVKSALGSLVTITESVVNSLNKTTVPEMREASSDGVLTETEMAKVKQTAVDTIKAELPDAMLVLLTKANVAVDSRISTEIESQVLQSKSFADCD